MVKVSVIIPCYNQGPYLSESVGSVLAQTFTDFEIVIVDDGSSDPETVSLLNTSVWPKTTILHVPHGGVSHARNAAISAASGTYILPLDADDKIGPDYLEKAAALLDQDADLGIVYCRAAYFGKKKGEWSLPVFHASQMARGNMIFNAGVFRKSDWETVGGYDPGMAECWEDYEFWVALLELGRTAFQIPEILFYYRIQQVSRNSRLDRHKMARAHQRVFERHPRFFMAHSDVLFDYMYEMYEKVNKFETPLSLSEVGEAIKSKLSVFKKSA